MRRYFDEPDFYAVLGVPADATDTEISRAFRRMALVNHPDRGGDADAFRDVYRARETLLDPLDRAAYDQRRRRGTSPNPARTSHRPRQPDSAGTADPFEWTTGAGPSSDSWAASNTGEPFSAYEPGYSWRRSDRFAWWKPAARSG